LTLHFWGGLKTLNPIIDNDIRGIMLFKVVDYLSTFDYLSIVSKLESE